MGIERLDEADAPAASREQASERGRGADGDPAIAPETRDQVTYRAEYRATVDAAYGATSASWDAAALELREAWESHEARWSLPDDSSLPRRRLEPEANAEVERGCGRIREVGENVITPAMRAIEAEDPGRHLIGLDHRLKGEDRIKEKVAAELEARPGLSASQALASVPDGIRFTFCYSDEHYVDGVTGDLELLAASGFKLAKPLKNSWDSDQYKGINTQWHEPETGQRFEVQFHTRASFEAKQLSHAAYERIRNPQTSAAELDELEDFQRQVCAKIPIPPSSPGITYAPRKERDG
jgi:hypothetical protein